MTEHISHEPSKGAEGETNIGAESPLEDIEALQHPYRAVLADVWEFAQTSEAITEQGRGVLVQVLRAYAANAAELEPALVDSAEAQKILGYRSEGSIRYAVQTGRLRPFREVQAPDGRTYRYFRRSDIEQIREGRE